jgi:hypothetical protein
MTGVTRSITYVNGQRRSGGNTAPRREGADGAPARRHASPVQPPSLGLAPRFRSLRFRPSPEAQQSVLQPHWRSADAPT